VIVAKYRRKALYSDDIRERLKDIVWTYRANRVSMLLLMSLRKTTIIFSSRQTPKTNPVNVVQCDRGCQHGDYGKSSLQQRICWWGVQARIAHWRMRTLHSRKHREEESLRESPRMSLCGFIADRDYNVAVNIHGVGMEQPFEPVEMRPLCHSL